VALGGRGADRLTGKEEAGRRIQVPSNTALLKLHDILQIVMGWEDYHLHMFTIEGLIYGDPADDEYGDLGSFADYVCVVIALRWQQHR